MIHMYTKVHSVTSQNTYIVTTAGPKYYNQPYKNYVCLHRVHTALRSNAQRTVILHLKQLTVFRFAKLSQRYS